MAFGRRAKGRGELGARCHESSKQLRRAVLFVLAALSLERARRLSYGISQAGFSKRWKRGRGFFFHLRKAFPPSRETRKRNFGEIGRVLR